MTMEERVLTMIKRDIAEYNDTSRVYYSMRETDNANADFYRGKITAMQNKLLDYCWELGYTINFVRAEDTENHTYYEKAILIENAE